MSRYLAGQSDFRADCWAVTTHLDLRLPPGEVAVAVGSIPRWAHSQSVGCIGFAAEVLCHELLFVFAFTVCIVPNGDV